MRGQLAVRTASAALAALGLVSCAGGDAPSPRSDVAGQQEPPEGPQVDWDRPVAEGIDLPLSSGGLASPHEAQAVSGAAFAPLIPKVEGATLMRVQATDPRVYPPEMLGYGVLLNIDQKHGFPVDGRVLFEESSAGPEDQAVVRALATNGAGYELITIDGVPVAFIHPDPQRASAVFVHEGIKVNIHGPAIPQDRVKGLVRAALASHS
jgi:hypothetical protein